MLELCKIHHFGNGLGYVVVASFRSQLQLRNVLCEVKVNHFIYQYSVG